MEQISNYEKQCEEWRQRFLTMDQEEICGKLPEIKKTEEKLALWHYGREFAVDRGDGKIRAVSDNRTVDVMPRLNIYTLFWYAKKDAVLSGRWVPFRELRNASPFGNAFQKGVLESLAATFSGHEELLESAVGKLRGVRLSASGFRLPAFSCMPVRLNFWDADDEFPAQANLLFDSSATDFNHVESVVTIATEALYQLANVAGLPVKGSPFCRF